MRPLASLPSHYSQRGRLDLGQQRAAALAINVGAIILVFVFGWLFLNYTVAVRPDMELLRLEAGNLLDLVWFLGWLLLIASIQVGLHEAIHGLFFWSFTGSRPKFGFTGLYAYAAAPDWYLPRNQHLITSLAPFVLITLAGLGLLLVLPAGLVASVLVIITLNAAGSIGDLVVALWLLSLPRSTMVLDAGEAITIYTDS